MTTTRDAEMEANRALQRRYLEELYVHRNIDFIDESLHVDGLSRPRTGNR